MRNYRLDSLELKGCNRLKPNAIERFKIDLTNPYQIIIGTNGSGKSSIMREMNPLPANPKEYSLDGYKIVCMFSNGQYYKLINDFKSKTHSFLVTDSTYETELENLNPSGNISTQRKLVKEYFHLDSEIMSVLLQEHDFRFTRMSKNMRKEWMLRLGDINLDFAIRLHRTVKQKYNEQVAVVKHLKKRIGDEEIRRISDEEIAELKRKSRVFTDELTDLMSAIIPNTINTQQIKNDIRSELNHLNGLANIKPITAVMLLDSNLLNIRDINPDPQSYLAVMSARIKEIESQRLRDNATIDRLYKESDRIRTLIATLNSNAAKSVADLQLEMTQVEQQLTTLKNSTRIGYIPEYVATAMTTREQFKLDLEQLVANLIENPDDYLNKARYDSALTELETLAQRSKELVRVITRAEHQLEHMAQNDATVCPKCKHNWYPLTDCGPDELRQRLLDYNTQLSNIEQDTNRLNEYVSTYDSRRNTLVSINALQRRAEHAVFIKYIRDQHYWERSNTWILQQLQYWYMECQTNLDIVQLQQRLDVLSGAIVAAAEVHVDDITTDRIQQLDDEINQIFAEQSIRSQESNDLTLAQSQLEALQKNQSAGLQCVRNLARLLNCLIDSSINDQIHSEIRDRQTVLSNIQSALQSAESIITVLESLESDLRQATTDLTIFDLLETELSPTQGLIAEYITDFINIFTDQLNEVIKQVWNQRLEVHPCGFDIESDSGELDYKFPLQTGLETAVDVSKGSSAQRDMIDFAFVMVVYLYAGLEHYPLYIDELAPTMDDLHRVRITQYVKQLMENNHHSQMFMISHYISGHGVFANADYCILSETNILHKPKEFNKHVIIE